MDNREAVNWLINISEDIGKAEHSDLWHYEQALTEIKDMLESAQLSQEGTTKGTTADTISRQAAIDAAELAYVRGMFPTPFIREVPPASPEYVTGFWLIRRWGDDAKCSNCGKTFKDVYDMENYDAFCRNCGTKMEGIKVTK